MVTTPPAATPEVPMPAKERVLGIDPGLQVTGYAILEPGLRGPIAIEAGFIRSSERRRAATMAERIRNLYDSIGEVLDLYRPMSMAVEQLYAHYDHPRTAILMAHARGAILLAAEQRGVRVTSYNATRIKKTVTGNGRAPKDQVQHAVQRELGLAKLPEPSDVADALAVALCHYHARVLPGEKER
jgi:crossover junction endodeoxyribonuclease RuvC